jgi:predicted enzyme related to lactoylglutathione lyase
MARQVAGAMQDAVMRCGNDGIGVRRWIATLRAEKLQFTTHSRRAVAHRYTIRDEGALSQTLSSLEGDAPMMEMKLELIPVPVSDVDRAKAFYVEQIGFNADHDHQVNEQLRFVQLTPPGSACSIAIGTGLTEMAPGSLRGLQMVVADVRALREELLGRGAPISEVESLPWGDFAYFSDPDGNTWNLQQITNRG